MKKEIIIYLASALVAVILMLVGLFTDLYPISDDLKPLTSLSVAIFAFIVGERVANYIREDNTIKSIRSQIPDKLTTIIRLNSLDEALDYLTYNIKRAEVLYNTRIEKTNEKDRSPRKSEIAFSNALNELIVEKDIELKEVFSPKFRQSAVERLKLTKNIGTYDARLIDIVPPSFLNFTIIDYGNDTKDLIIGWATCGIKSEIHQPSFVIHDNRIVEYFQDIFDAMYSNGADIDKN